MDIQKAIGGVEFKDVISFQTRVMFGAQFGRVTHAKKQKDIIIACLRVGWNDAFRHTSENVIAKATKQSKKTKSVLELKNEEWKKTHKNDYDDFICCEILNSEVLLGVFEGFAKAPSTDEKIKAIQSKEEGLKELFKPYKQTEGEKRLCFGHFQKMFNIALKMYLCLYMCREYLEIDDSLFEGEIIDNLKNADCPVDSIILNSLSKDSGKKEYEKMKWSKFGTENHLIDQYAQVQHEISEMNCVREKSNLYYDFFSWNKADGLL